MRKLVHSKLKAFISETDNMKKEMIANRLKDLFETAPDIFEKTNEQEIKPILTTAIDKYAYNPSTANQLHLLKALGTIGF